MWRTVKLGDVCNIATGKKDVNEGNPRGMYPFFTCAKEHTFSDGYSFDCEAILIAGNGAVGQTTYHRGKFEAYQRTYVLSDFSSILPRLLLLILQGRLMHHLSTIALGNTIPYIKKGMLQNFEIPLPPLAEQQRIVAKLDAVFAEIDRAIDVASSKLLDVGKLAKATLSTVFEELATGNQTTLGEYYDVRDGTHDSPKYVSEGYPLVTSKNLKTGSLDLSNAKCISEADYIAINKRSAVHAGDVLMAMIGTIGNPIVITEEPRFSIKNVALFKTGANQNPWYLKYFLELPGTIKKMQQDAKGTTQKFVGLGYLRKFPFCAPPLATQDKAVERIDTLLNEIATHEKMIKASIENYVALKSAILAQELQPPQSDAA